MTHDDDTCKVELKLQDVHLWVHAVVKALTLEEQHRAQEVANRILDVLNDSHTSNPVKFLAMYEVICVGADVLDQTMYRIDSNSTVTVH